MTIQINGEPEEFSGEVTVSQLLAHRKVSMPDMVTVELNDAILDRKTFATTVLRDGDRVEFLYFMGGGSR